MGQTLPLPQRIPVPTEEQQKQLQEHGIKVNLEGLEADQKFVAYELPSTHYMHDDSWREDLPEFYIVRKNTKFACAKIHGSWKVSYDNRLRLEVFDEEREVKLRANDVPVIPSDSSAAALFEKAVATNDPVVIRTAMKGLCLQKEAK